MNKAHRQSQILRLIRRKQVHTQDELARELGALDIQTTQVTLSRDIRELRLVKTADGYQPVAAAAPRGPGFTTVAAEFVNDVKAAQNLVVMRTSPGNANAVAVALDREDWPDVVGTIAGDDTVLVIAPDIRTASSLRKKFLSILQ